MTKTPWLPTGVRFREHDLPGSTRTRPAYLAALGWAKRRSRS